MSWGSGSRNKDEGTPYGLLGVLGGLLGGLLEGLSDGYDDSWLDPLKYHRGFVGDRGYRSYGR